MKQRIVYGLIGLLLRGRRYALPEDMTDLVPDVMRHRIVLSYEALAENVTADAIVLRLLAQVPAPDRPLAHSAAAHA